MRVAILVSAPPFCRQVAQSAHRNAERVSEKGDHSAGILVWRGMLVAAVPATGHDPQVFRVARGGEQRIAVSALVFAIDQQQRTRADLRDVVDRTGVMDAYAFERQHPQHQPALDADV